MDPLKYNPVAQSIDRNHNLDLFEHVKRKTLKVTEVKYIS